MNITYHLYDDGGVCTVYDIPFKLPVGSIFEHEFGRYKLERYHEADIAICERIATCSEMIAEEKLLEDAKNLLTGGANSSPEKAYFKDEGGGWILKLTPDEQLPKSEMYPFGFLKKFFFHSRQEIVEFCQKRNWDFEIE